MINTAHANRSPLGLAPVNVARASRLRRGDPAVRGGVGARSPEFVVAGALGWGWVVVMCIGPVLERVTRARLAFLERLYSDLGVPADQAARHARLAYALYLGIGELRRADPDSDPDGPELDAYLNLAVDSMIPPTVSANNAGG